ncbi:uncharacterized protein LOC110907744 [Helianthus annuus]|uniref:uncharacterized protein LOC110907744 n=1 Tax=Helianthus annuus TaxID=4232 RepID=UPI000B8F5196|nr:uncharacterized protein LOC110907744 [Helianthus annuus]
MDTKLHPAVTVTNIKSFIPITLESDSAQYATWSEFFRLHCRAFLVSDHLEPPAATTSNTTKTTDTEKTSDPKPAIDSWERLDAIVLQWIYGTISPDLVQTIMKKGSSAYVAWAALEALFQDNKAVRAIYLKQKFNSTRLENFSNMATYCQELKVLADQLNNVEAPVDDQSLVLQTLAGLTDSYDAVATVLGNTKPLPSFNEVRSQLCMNETRKANQASSSVNSAGSALHITSRPATSPNTSTPPTDYRTETGNNRGRSRGRGRGRGRPAWNRNRNPNQPQQFSAQYPWPYGPPVWPNTHSQNSQWPTWASPPCPYPTTPQHNSHTSGQGILGPRPNVANVAYTPTDIAQAMYTLSLNPPDWNSVMDTGATGHYLQPSGTSQSHLNKSKKSIYHCQ